MCALLEERILKIMLVGDLVYNDDFDCNCNYA